MDFCSILLSLLPLLQFRDCLGTGMWGNKKRKTQRWIFILFLRVGSVFSHFLKQLLLELSRSVPSNLLICFQAVLSSGWEDIGGKKKNDKFNTSSTVLQILVFFPKLLATFYVSESSSTLSCFYSCSQSVQPGGVCFFCMMQNWKISSTFFEPGQKRAGDLIHRATLLSSITTTAPLPWVSLPQLMLLPSTHLQEFHRDRLQLELRQLWCLAHGGLQRVQTTKKHFFLQKSIPII